MEAFCLYSSCKDKITTMYRLNDDRTTTKMKPELNKCYIDAPRPKWCIKNNKERIPQFRCLIHNGEQCPFFSYTEATLKDKRIFGRAWHEANKK